MAAKLGISKDFFSEKGYLYPHRQYTSFSNVFPYFPIHVLHHTAPIHPMVCVFCSTNAYKCITLALHTHIYVYIVYIYIYIIIHTCTHTHTRTSVRIHVTSFRNMPWRQWCGSSQSSWCPANSRGNMINVVNQMSH